MEKSTFQFWTFIVFVALLYVVFMRVTINDDPARNFVSKFGFGQQTRIAIGRINSALNVYIENEKKLLDKIKSSRMEKQFFLQSLLGTTDYSLHNANLRQVQMRNRTEFQELGIIAGINRAVRPRKHRLVLQRHAQTITTTAPTAKTTNVAAQPTTTTSKINYNWERKFNQKDLVMFRLRMKELYPNSDLANRQYERIKQPASGFTSTFVKRQPKSWKIPLSKSSKKE